MFQEQKEIQQDEIKLMSILFLHHSKSNELTIIHKLKEKSNRNKLKLEISPYFYVRGEMTDTDFRVLLDKKSKFEKLENYSLLIIEGNLGKPGSSEPGDLSNSIIKQAISENKEIIILIITGTVECAIKLLRTYEKYKIYYVMEKALDASDEPKLQQYLNLCNEQRVFASFSDARLYSKIYSLLTPLSSEDDVPRTTLSYKEDSHHSMYGMFEKSTPSPKTSEGSVSTTPASSSCFESNQLELYSLYPPQPTLSHQEVQQVVQRDKTGIGKKAKEFGRCLSSGQLLRSRISWEVDAAVAGIPLSYSYDNLSSKRPASTLTKMGKAIGQGIDLFKRGGRSLRLLF